MSLLLELVWPRTPGPSFWNPTSSRIVTLLLNAEDQRAAAAAKPARACEPSATPPISSRMKVGLAYAGVQNAAAAAAT